MHVSKNRSPRPMPTVELLIIAVGILCFTGCYSAVGHKIRPEEHPRPVEVPREVTFSSPPPEHDYLPADWNRVTRNALEAHGFILGQPATEGCHLEIRPQHGKGGALYYLSSLIAMPTLYLVPSYCRTSFGLKADLYDGKEKVASYHFKEAVHTTIHVAFAFRGDTVPPSYAVDPRAQSKVMNAFLGEVTADLNDGVCGSAPADGVSPGG